MEEIGPTLPEMMLEDLRWKPDQAIINHFGESVWLKQVPPQHGTLGYITECCSTDDPCERHACICAQPLREDDVLAPCPIHGWVTQ